MTTRASALPPSMVITAVNLWKAYDHGKIQVLQGVDLSIRAGETVALCGASGSGKSTLLNIVGGLDSADHGVVHILDSPIDTQDARTNLLRGVVGFVFQLHNLIADLTLMENCLVPALAAGKRPAQARDRILELLEATGIAHRTHRPAQELSGGERQRAALCRALVNKPEIVLADEPTGSLDEENGTRILDLLFGIVEREKTTLLLATHDRAVAERCDRLIFMRDGRII